MFPFVDKNGQVISPAALKNTCTSPPFVFTFIVESNSSDCHNVYPIGPANPSSEITATTSFLDGATISHSPF